MHCAPRTGSRRYLPCATWTPSTPNLGFWPRCLVNPRARRRAVESSGRRVARRTQQADWELTGRPASTGQRGRRNSRIHRRRGHDHHRPPRHLQHGGPPAPCQRTDYDRLGKLRDERLSAYVFRRIPVTPAASSAVSAQAVNLSMGSAMVSQLVASEGIVQSEVMLPKLGTTADTV